MKRTVRFLVGGLLIASIVTACGGDTVDDPFGGYEIEQYRNASGELTDPAPDSYPYLAVDAAGIAGNTGCNSFFAGATIGSDGSWSLDDAIGMTLMACMPPLDQQEQDITRALQSVDAWDPVGDAATLLADGETVMVLHKIDTKLEGTAWVITGVNNGTGGVTSLIATSEPSIEFGAEDRFTMNTGCNTASGTYTTDGTSAVAFEQVITTEMACLEPEGLMDQERMLLDALATTTTYEITGVTITFRDDDGAARFTGRLTESPLP